MCDTFYLKLQCNKYTVILSKIAKTPRSGTRCGTYNDFMHISGNKLGILSIRRKIAANAVFVYKHAVNAVIRNA